MYFLETLQVCAPSHGGVLYSFWYWWNVVWIFYEFFKYWTKIKFCFQYFKFSSCFMLFPTLKKKLNPGEGGGGFMLFSTLKKYIEKCPFTYWLNGRWFLQIVERDSWHLYPLYSLFPCSDFVSQIWGWFGGGGGCNVFLTFYVIRHV